LTGEDLTPMAVYFVYRSDALRRPSERHSRRFDDDAVLDWFRRIWRPIADLEEAHQYAQEILGVSVPYAGQVFTRIAEGGARPPASVEEVREVFDQTGHFTVARQPAEEHAFQALASDGDVDSVLYVFDDAFVGRHPDLTAFLLSDGPLPDAPGLPGGAWRSSHPAVEELEPVVRGSAEGRVYSLCNFRQDELHYTELSAADVDLLVGLRLPGLCRWLMSEAAAGVEPWAYLLSDLREALLTADLAEDEQEAAFVGAIREGPDDEATWRAYADWLMERGEPSPGARLLRLALARLRVGAGADPSRNVVRVGEHVAQCCLHGGEGDYLEWFCFDDLWGAAHPVLADALIRYASRWDVLSTGDETRQE
jgi:uncharacterized protein (TIGR02996 family)